MRTLVRSDLLHALLGFVERRSQVASLLQISRFRLVIDANPVLRDLYWIHKTRRNSAARSDLRELLASGLVIPYAPPDLDREVREQFPRLCAEHGIPLDRLEESWRDYRSVITLLSPRASAKGVRTLAMRDYDDLPYAQLAFQIGAAGIVTSDHHFEGTDVFICEPSTVKALRTHARAAATELAVSLGGSAVAVASGIIAFKTLGVVGNALRRTPIALQLTAVGLALAIVLNPRTRQGLAHLAESSGDTARELVTSIFVAIDELWSNARSARTEHPVPQLSNQTPLTLVDHAAIACAEARAPLTLREIAARAAETGYTSDAAEIHRSRYLRQVLSADRRFERAPNRRWRLKSPIES